MYSTRQKVDFVSVHAKTYTGDQKTSHSDSRKNGGWRNHSLEAGDLATTVSFIYDSREFIWKSLQNYCYKARILYPIQHLYISASNIFLQMWNIQALVYKKCKPVSILFANFPFSNLTSNIKFYLLKTTHLRYAILIVIDGSSPALTVIKMHAINQKNRLISSKPIIYKTFRW